MEMVRIDYRLIDDEEDVPLKIEYSESLMPIITIMYHKIWLSLMRTLIPGISENLRDKLSEICDSVLKEMLVMGDTMQIYNATPQVRQNYNGQGGNIPVTTNGSLVNWGWGIRKK